MNYQLVLLEWWVVGELSVSVDGVVGCGWIISLC